MSGYHVAQLNIGLPIEPVDSQRLASLVAQLEPINALADAAAGFVPMREAYTALWWVAAGHRPSVDEARARLELLRERGPSADVFTLQRPYPAPDQDTTPTVEDDWFCPA